MERVSSVISSGVGIPLSIMGRDGVAGMVDAAEELVGGEKERGGEASDDGRSYWESGWSRRSEKWLVREEVQNDDMRALTNNRVNLNDSARAATKREGGQELVSLAERRSP